MKNDGCSLSHNRSKYRYNIPFLQVLDDKNVRRRFRASNYQSTTRVKPFICTMPMRLDEGWNQIQFNLSDFTRRAYGTNYVETLRVQIHANCRIRRVYFSDRLYSEDELPPEFKLFLPIQKPVPKSLSQPNVWSFIIIMYTSMRLCECNIDNSLTIKIRDSMFNKNKLLLTCNDNSLPFKFSRIQLK